MTQDFAADMSSQLFIAVLIFAIATAFMHGPNAATRVVFGSALRHGRESPKALRILTVTTGLSLAASLVPVLWEG